MLKERVALAQKVAQEVHQAEAAIDAAIARLGVLVTSLPEAQAAARLSSVAGDTAFGHLQTAMTGLFASRTNVVALHNELANVKDKMGLRHIVVGFGDAGKLLPARGQDGLADGSAEQVTAKAA